MRERGLHPPESRTTPEKGNPVKSLDEGGRTEGTKLPDCSARLVSSLHPNLALELSLKPVFPWKPCLLVTSKWYGCLETQEQGGTVIS